VGLQGVVFMAYSVEMVILLLIILLLFVFLLPLLPLLVILLMQMIMLNLFQGSGVKCPVQFEHYAASAQHTPARPPHIVRRVNLRTHALMSERCLLYFSKHLPVSILVHASPFVLLFLR
jgi:hypothetical protein